jgi:hypothetical protein
MRLLDKLGAMERKAEIRDHGQVEELRKGLTTEEVQYLFLKQ